MQAVINLTNCRMFDDNIKKQSLSLLLQESIFLGFIVTESNGRVFEHSCQVHMLAALFVCTCLSVHTCLQSVCKELYDTDLVVLP